MQGDSIRVLPPARINMPFPFRRIHTYQVFDEEITAAVLAIVSAHGVSHAGYKQEIYMFVGFYQRVNELESRSRVYIIVHFAQNQQQFALQFMRVGYVGRLLVML